MRTGQFDFYAMGDAALELGIARSNLRYYIDLGKVPAKRASDGSRLLSHEDVKAARVWIGDHEAEKKRQKQTTQKARDSALRKIQQRRKA